MIEKMGTVLAGGLLLLGCQGGMDMHDETMETRNVPSLMVTSAEKIGTSYRVLVKKENFSYENNEEANKNGESSETPKGIPTHWHLERDISQDGNSHNGFIACSYSDELTVDTSLVSGSNSMIVSMRDGNHAMIGGAYHMMDQSMGMECLEMENMDMDSQDGHMMNMSSGGMMGGGGHMMDMSTGMVSGMNMPMMSSCKWEETGN